MLPDSLNEKALFNACYDTCKRLNQNQAWLWLEAQCAAVAILKDDFTALEVALASARRYLGDAPLEPQEPFFSWRMCDAGRVLLLLAAIKLPTWQSATGIAHAFDNGDEYEKEAIIKGLTLLDPKGHLLALAVDTCRTNILPLFRAIALNNPYPAQFFSQHEFNQMVLKSLFMSLDIVDVVGLSSRTNPQLSRMCFDYLQERLAAHRALPPSIWLAIRANEVEGALEALNTTLLTADGLLKQYAEESFKQYCAGKPSC